MNKTSPEEKLRELENNLIKFKSSQPASEDSVKLYYTTITVARSGSEFNPNRRLVRFVCETGLPVIANLYPLEAVTNTDFNGMSLVTGSSPTDIVFAMYVTKPEESFICISTQPGYLAVV